MCGQLLSLLADHYEHAGTLGELVLQADRASTAQNIGANPAKALQAPKHSLQHHLLMGLRHLIKNEFKLNQPGAAGWLTEDHLWLVSKTATDKLRAYLLAQSVDGIPPPISPCSMSCNHMDWWTRHRKAKRYGMPT